VTPGLEDTPPAFPPGTFPNSGPGYRSQGVPPEWLGWTWAQSRDRTAPWIGLLLVVVGAGLLVEYFVPAISAMTLILTGISVAFFAGFLFGRSLFALVPALLIGALAVARLIEELHIYTGPGTTALAVAVAFLLIWLAGVSRSGSKRPRWSWALWAAGIFGLIGLVEVGGQLSSIGSFGAVWPLAIIVLGLIVVLNGRRGATRRC
jgi:hypothetical protein